MDMTNEISSRCESKFVHWFFIAALKGVEITDVVREKPADITMFINGVEMNPLNAINRLEEEMERMITERAQEMVTEIKNDILDPFHEQVADMTSALEKLCEEKLGYERED